MGSVYLRSIFEMLFIFFCSITERTCSERLYFCRFWRYLYRDREYLELRFITDSRVAKSGSLPITDLFLG